MLGTPYHAVGPMNTPHCTKEKEVDMLAFLGGTGPEGKGLALRFALAGEEARLTIYNLTGQRVRLLAADTRQAGEHRLTWDACDKQGRAVATGVYVYRLEMGEEAVYRRMLLVR